MYIPTYSEYYRRACRKSPYARYSASYHRYYQIVEELMYKWSSYLGNFIKSARIQARRMRFLFTYHFIVKKLHRKLNRGIRQILKVLHTNKVFYIKRKQNRSIV